MFDITSAPVSRMPRALTAIAVLALAAGAAQAQKGETVKLAYIDALSGLMGPVGQNQVKTFQFLGEKTNKSNPSGVKFEVVTFDLSLIHI